MTNGARAPRSAPRPPPRPDRGPGACKSYNTGRAPATTPGRGSRLADVATKVLRTAAALSFVSAAGCSTGVSVEPSPARRVDLTTATARRVRQEIDALCALDAPSPPALARAPELVKLHARVAARRPTLLKLMRAGMVGETWEGRLEAVKAIYLVERSDPSASDGITIGGLLAEEDRDRLRIYELIATGRPISAENIGIEYGLRSFATAEGSRFVRPRRSDWVKAADRSAATATATATAAPRPDRPEN